MPSSGPDICGSAAEHAINSRDFAHAQGAVFGFTQAKGQIKSFAGQINLAIRQPQPDRDIRIAGDKRGYLWRDQLPPDAKGCGNTKRSAQLFCDIDDLRLCAVHRIQHVNSARVEQPPLFGWCEIADGALKQPDGKMLLQLGDAGRGYRG